MEQYKGIDVSDLQGVIDWGLVKKEGCQFAILRSVKHSGKADGQFTANVRGCRENNIPAAVYKYTYARTAAEAEEEARQVAALLKENDLTCKVFWDVEDRECLYPLGREKLTEAIKAAERIITGAGYGFGLYVGLYVYNEQWFDFSQFTCPLWIARYPVSGAHTFGEIPPEKYKPEVGREMYGWQFTASGKINGIKTDVDLDILYEDPATLQESSQEDWQPDGEGGYLFQSEEITRQQAQQLLKMAQEIKIGGKLFRAL